MDQELTINYLTWYAIFPPRNAHVCGLSCTYLQVSAFFTYNYLKHIACNTVNWIVHVYIVVKLYAAMHNQQDSYFSNLHSSRNDGVPFSSNI